MRYVKLLILWLFAAVTVQAQKIQTLPADPAVKSGVLPNGITYYVVANPSSKGVADFALVQKTGALTIPGVDRDITVAASQDALSSQYRLSAPSVQDFFMSHGVVPERNGFAYVTDNATVFRFDEVLLGGAGDVMDSTLLVLMGIVEKTAQTDVQALKGWYAPSDQALVIAGDVNPDQVIGKIRMLSYMIPLQNSFPRREYEWREQDTLCVREVVDDPRNLATITAGWRLQRTPREYMNTIQPAIYERYMTELGIVAKNRIENSLKIKGIPFADVSYGYTSGSESLEDAHFRMSVSVAPENMEQGVSVLASVLSDLDAGNAHMYEVSRAGRIYRNELKNRMKGLESNAEYVDRCISAFVYNTPLTSKKDMVDFHSSRNLAEADDLRIFNSIVSASIDGTKNLLLECKSEGKSISSDIVKEVFASSWTTEKRAAQSYELSRLPAYITAGEPLKLKKVRKEHMSGGTIWTLSNGFKVVFLPMSAQGSVYYSLCLNGGYGSVSDLLPGEGAYFSEILKLSRIGGMGAEAFFDALRQKGISMNLNIGLSVSSVRGVVPEGELESLMQALLLVMNDRVTDNDKFSYYRECELLRQEYMKGSIDDRIAAIDDIICPGYRYSHVRSASVLSDDFIRKADAFMASQAVKMNDGMLVLVGDLDEKMLKSLLLKYASDFITDNDRKFTRSVVSYQPISGTVTHSDVGETNSIDMVLSVPMSLTAENYYLASIASLALKNELSRVISGTGMWLKLNHNCRKDPQERYNVFITMNEASTEGFVAGTAVDDPLVALKAVRNALENPNSLDISAKELESYKAMVKKSVAERKKNPEYWLNAISMRYLDGKDFTTGYDSKIDAVTVDKVKAILSSLAEGSRVEYIISRK